MPSTAELRRAWAPACVGPFVKIPLNGEGVISVKASTAEAWEALNRVLVKYGYRTRKEDTGAYNCRKITGGDLYSLHAYAIASDLNWKTNPYGKNLVTDMSIEMIQDIEAIRTNSGDDVFRWGGRYSGNKDAMHFEIVCTPAQLATGIKPFYDTPVVVPVPPSIPNTSTKRKSRKAMEAALLLIMMHYDNARGGGKRTYDVSKSDPQGHQHWVQELLKAEDAGRPLSEVTDSLGVQLYLEVLRNQKKA